MNNYDNSKDEVLDYRVVENSSGTGGYEVSLRRYDKGNIKICIDAFFYGKQGERKYNSAKRWKLSYASRIFEAITEMENNLSNKL